MRILYVIGALALLIASPAMAKDGPLAWIVTQKSGEVRVLRSGLQPASVQVRGALSAGDIVATGANGRATLTRGDDYVIVAPSSRLLLPKEEKRTGFTRLVQQVGTMLYNVRHTGVPHFAVDTPILAAVVKGTKFTVVVDKDRAAVQVTEGLVEVSSRSGEARRLVEGGLTVYIGRERPNEIIEMKAGAAEPVAPGGSTQQVQVESSGDVPLSTIVNLTDGLVQEAPTAPVVASANIPTPDVLTPVPAATAPVPSEPIGQAPLPDVTEPVVDPVTDVTEPVAEPVVEPVAEVVEPVVDVVEPVVDVVEPVVEPVVEVVEPVADVVEPVVDVVEPVVDVVEPVAEVVEPVVDIVEPVVDVVEPVVEPVVEIVEPVVEIVEPVVEIVEPVVEIVEPVVEPIVEVVEPVVEVVEPVVEIVEPVVEPIVEVVEPVVEVAEPVVEIVEPVVEPIVEVVEPVVEPVVEVVEPVTEVVEPVTDLLGGLLGG